MKWLWRLIPHEHRIDGEGRVVSSRLVGNYADNETIYAFDMRCRRCGR